MAVTSIDISPDLLARVKDATGLRTNREAVTYALEEVVRRERQKLAIRWIHANDPLADLADPEVTAQARS